MTKCSHLKDYRQCSNDFIGTLMWRTSHHTYGMYYTKVVVFNTCCQPLDSLATPFLGKIATGAQVVTFVFSSTHQSTKPLLE